MILAKKQMTRSNSFHDKELFFDREHCVAMNIAFAKAMLAARRVGNITFVIGVEITTRTKPFRPTRIAPVPVASFMTSAAGALVDEGLEEFKSREWAI
jgi:hypothetical protein